MAIIPARLASQRLPEKPLQKILDKPLITYVADAVQETGVFDKVYVATDSQKIMELFEDSKVEAFMTSDAHESGTDRIFDAAAQIKEDFDTIFNIQGDEPFVYGDDLKTLKIEMEKGASMASLYEPLKNSDVDDANKVKVLLDDESNAIYFSRFGIPFSRLESVGPFNNRYVGKHIGIYAYSKNFLKDFCETPVGHHEKNEKLEQLRALQMGAKIKMVFTENKYRGVDTKEDLDRVNNILSEKR